jgi:hypothetical protein
LDGVINKKDITNNRFGNLFAIKSFGGFARDEKIYCICDCGNTAIVYRKYPLKKGYNKYKFSAKKISISLIQFFKMIHSSVLSPKS